MVQKNPQNSLRILLKLNNSIDQKQWYKGLGGKGTKEIEERKQKEHRVKKHITDYL